MHKNREHVIEDAIIAKPKVLGFAGADAIRNVRVAWGFGRIDLMLFPKSGPKIVLIEAKDARASDAASKVIGQLLMYYAGALQIGSKGLRLLREFSQHNVDKALSHTWISPKQITGGVSPPSAAWSVLQSGKKLRSQDMVLFIALSDSPQESLIEATTVLREQHRLDIGIVVVKDGKAQVLKQY